MVITDVAVVAAAAAAAVYYRCGAGAYGGECSIFGHSF